MPDDFCMTDSCATETRGHQSSNVGLLRVDLRIGRYV